MNNNQDHLNLLRKIQNKQKYTQRELAEQLGFSLGKLNYCLKELKNNGFIKVKNFKNSNKKISFIYNLTSKGIAKKTKLTQNFMKENMREYSQLVKEIDIKMEI